MYLPERLYKVMPAVYFVLGLAGFFTSPGIFGQVAGALLAMIAMWIIIKRMD